MNYYVGTDSETGGLDENKTDVLTAYFGIFDENLQLVEELELKLKPDGGRWPVTEASALAVNKIDVPAHMADPETISYSEAKVKVITLFKKYLKKNGRYSNLRALGHNVGFDIRFFTVHLMTRTEWDNHIHYGVVDTKPIVDFLKDCGWFPKELGSLGSLVEFLGVPKRNAHSAKDDTLMCVDCYKALLELMKSKKEGGTTQDLISLLEAE